jgi:hypothetical protein
MRLERAILIVLDGCGVGAAPDAADYGDTGENTPNTLGHLAEAVGGLNLPCLQSLGLGNILPLRGVPPADAPRAHYGKVQPHSKGKDSVTGHWEMMGIHTETPFPTYPDGFPPEVIRAFEAQIGRETLGNYPASGTEIIKQLGHGNTCARQADCLHQRGQRVPNRRARGGHPAGGTLSDVRNRPRAAAAAAPCAARDCPPVRGGQPRHFSAHREPSRLPAAAARKSHRCAACARRRRLWDWRCARTVRVSRVPPRRAHPEQRRALRRAAARPAKRLRVHFRELRGLRYAVRASERPCRLRPPP